MSEQLRFGRVTERDAAAARVRVRFLGADHVVSWWLPVLVAKASADAALWMPDVGEHVVCLMSDEAEIGVVLGAIYSDARRPPAPSLDTLSVRFRDGTSIEYDRAAHRLRVDVCGSVELRVAPGGHVKLGDPETARRLLTEDVLPFLDAHTHPTPAGPSGPPMIPLSAQRGLVLTEITRAR